jgi:hypothetical protein
VSLETLITTPQPKFNSECFRFRYFYSPHHNPPNNKAMTNKFYRMLQEYKSLQDIIAILGMDELSEADKESFDSIFLRRSMLTSRIAYRRACTQDPKASNFQRIPIKFCLTIADSFPSHSPSPRFSPVSQALWSISRTLSDPSTTFLMAKVMTFQKVLSTWLETSILLAPRARRFWPS